MFRVDRDACSCYLSRYIDTHSCTRTRVLGWEWIAYKLGIIPSRRTTPGDLFGSSTGPADSISKISATAMKLLDRHDGNRPDIVKLIRPIITTSWNVTSLKADITLDGKIGTIRNKTRNVVVCIQDTHDNRAAGRLLTRLPTCNTKSIAPHFNKGGGTSGGIAWIIPKATGYRSIQEPTIIEPV